MILLTEVPFPLGIGIPALIISIETSELKVFFVQFTSLVDVMTAFFGSTWALAAAAMRASLSISVSE